VRAQLTAPPGALPLRMPTGSGAGMAAFEAAKRAVLGALTGTVLEIGAGRGVNFGYFRADIRWIGLEPSAAQRRGLAAAAAAAGQHAPVLTAPAERIPLPEASVDAVAATVVLCSVADQQATLAEIRRVLRPSGVFAFFEHVAAPAGTWSRRAQRAVSPVTRLFDAGCDPGRDTGRAIEAAGFRRVDARRYVSGRGTGLYGHYLAGIAHV
jgi:ubiquinone/menaquinone biosynthesis C-methylase UbiE